MDKREINKILKTKRGIVNKYICPLCFSEHECEDDAQECLNKGFSNDLPEKIDIEVNDYIIFPPYSVYVVNGFCLDEDHTNLKCMVRAYSYVTFDAIGETMTMFIDHALEGKEIYQMVIEEKTTHHINKIMDEDVIKEIRGKAVLTKDIREAAQ